MERGHWEVVESRKNLVKEIRMAIYLCCHYISSAGEGLTLKENLEKPETSKREGNSSIYQDAGRAVSFDGNYSL